MCPIRCEDLVSKFRHGPIIVRETCEELGLSKASYVRLFGKNGPVLKFLGEEWRDPDKPKGKGAKIELRGHIFTHYSTWEDGC